jgi:flavin-dependent dehydrogenase
VTLRLLPGGYAGLAPVGSGELNVCLVGRGAVLPALRAWAQEQFDLPDTQAWQSIAPLTRAPLRPAHPNSRLLLAGDTARVVEPFTGEGIYYALKSGVLAAETVIACLRGSRRQGEVGALFAGYAREHARLYHQRLWVNQLARLAVTRPVLGNALFALGRRWPAGLRYLSGKVIPVG